MIKYVVNEKNIANVKSNNITWDDKNNIKLNKIIGTTENNK